MPFEMNPRTQSPLQCSFLVMFLVEAGKKGSIFLLWQPQALTAVASPLPPLQDQPPPAAPDLGTSPTAFAWACHYLTCPFGDLDPAQIPCLGLIHVMSAAACPCTAHNPLLPQGSTYTFYREDREAQVSF